MKILEDLAEQVSSIAKVEAAAKLDGRNMTMVLAPDRRAKQAVRKPGSPDGARPAGAGPGEGDAVSGTDGPQASPGRTSTLRLSWAACVHLHLQPPWLASSPAAAALRPWCLPLPRQPRYQKRPVPAAPVAAAEPTLVPAAPTVAADPEPAVVTGPAPATPAPAANSVAGRRSHTPGAPTGYRLAAPSGPVAEPPNRRHRWQPPPSVPPRGPSSVPEGRLHFPFCYLVPSVPCWVTSTRCSTGCQRGHVEAQGTSKPER